MPKVIVLRGTPGSGKSSWCKKEYPCAIVCSADQYFLDDCENYKFDRTLLDKAHSRCLHKFIWAIDSIGKARSQYPDSVVIVDNTNAFPLEMAPYIAVAKAYDLEVEIIRFNCSIKTSIDRNIHNVPEETIVRMWQKLQKKQFPSWWPKETIIDTD